MNAVDAGVLSQVARWDRVCRTVLVGDCIERDEDAYPAHDDRLGRRRAEGSADRLTNNAKRRKKARGETEIGTPLSVIDSAPLENPGPGG
jgi:hypothetical protein